MDANRRLSFRLFGVTLLGFMLATGCAYRLPPFDVPSQQVASAFSLADLEQLPTDESGFHILKVSE